MDIGQFLDLKPQWAMEPALYIVRQEATENPNAHRCGASGTQLFSGTDLPYGSDRASSTGLLSRMNMYANYWLPVKGKIFAALRVKRALVAEVGKDRIGQDVTGGNYNIDRGNNTLVLTREKEFHQELDRRGLRWQKDKRNELFVPKKNTQELIAAMRTIRGENMYLMFPDAILEDSNYRGGARRDIIKIRETTSRNVPDRTARVPSITIRLSKDSLDQLRSGNPSMFSRLMSLVKAYDTEVKDKKPESQIKVGMKGSDIEKLKTAVASGVTPIKGLNALFKPRRSARLAELNDDITETTTPV